MAKTFLGIGSYSVPLHIKHNKINAFSLIDIAKEHNIKCIQIADNLPLSFLLPEELIKLKNKIKKNGMTLETGMRGITVSNLDNYIELTHFLESKLLRCVIDKSGFTPTEEEINTILKNALPKLKEYNITLGIENHDRFFSCQFKKIIERIDSRHIGIVLDTANSLSKEEPLDAVLDNLAHYTVSFHVKDYDIIRNPYGMGLLITGMPSGKGRLDIPTILSRLYNEARNDFSSIIEFWIDEKEDQDSSLKEEKAWLNESIAFMEQIIATQ